MSNMIDMTPDSTGRYTRNTAPFATMNAVITDLGIAFERAGYVLRAMVPDNEPPSRSERRQLASPRYQRAASHGADGQRARAHKAWKGE